MPTKLKNLEVSKVDFVDEGANPDADIKLLKRKDGAGQSSDNEGGNGVGNILKKLLGFFGKAAGMDQKEIDSAVDEIQKGDSVSFNEKLNEANYRKIADEIWDMCYALQSSLCSILNDDELDEVSAENAMQESLNEFLDVMQGAIAKWASGKEASIVMKSREVSDTELNMMKSVVERLNESIEKAGKDTKPVEKLKEEEPHNGGNEKGDEKEMRIDKSKLTPEEKDFLESIEKRCGMEDGDGSSDGSSGILEEAPGAIAMAKAAGQLQTTTEPVAQADPDDIYKGLHPAVVAEMEELKKFRQVAEEKELTNVAKKYEIIGKKTEELVPLFKSLKAAGGTAYADMIAVLDQAVATVEKSGAFSEVGRMGHGNNESSAEAKAEGIAKSYMEKDPGMSHEEAVAKAWENNAGLLAEYDDQEGF